MCGLERCRVYFQLTKCVVHSRISQGISNIGTHDVGTTYIKIQRGFDESPRVFYTEIDKCTLLEERFIKSLKFLKKAGYKR